MYHSMQEDGERERNKKGGGGLWNTLQPPPPLDFRMRCNNKPGPIIRTADNALSRSIS